MKTGDWFCTFTGKQFYITDPDPADVDIRDIAHALSMVCRFGGHTREFYSVAQHSVHCSELIASWGHKPLLQFHALVHDASEAYLGDIVRPLKYSLPSYLALESKTMKAIYDGLGLAPLHQSEAQLIKYADDCLLMTERRDLIEHKEREWKVRAEPLEFPLYSWSPQFAEKSFTESYFTLLNLCP